MSSHPISPLDSAFLTLEVPSTPLQIGAVVELALPDDSTSAHERFDRVRQVIAERIHEIPVLAERVLRPPFDLGIVSGHQGRNLHDYVTLRLEARHF